ncbi:hypothetical protein EXIGLDRAFT_600482 [Exidia glandulosa HHB12029]|uniref:TPR-like protein n=1 Tax=Exidia glandulosa HHB12029 TaxID=1314781 RepID=A0A165QHT2_EXIGL|nr:hypothetical protein EXIGLDRAFT_600482 [Exidia glandulosa HHB12029]
MPAQQSSTPAPNSRRTKKKQRVGKPKPVEDAFPLGELSSALFSVPKLERTISGILLRRFELDIARLFSTHVYRLCERELPRLLQHFIVLGSPGWAARNARSDDVRDFFRATLAMDLRQAGERVATKSVLWSYTALRHFAVARGVHICEKRGLHSARLLPHLKALKTHLRLLEHPSQSPVFTKPPHLPSLTRGGHWLPPALETLCAARPGSRAHAAWCDKVRLGYERLADSLWDCAREFSVHGYGLVLRDKLTTKWCECGCSTDHLGEVCERTVREDEDEAGRRPGKEREWDGRGSGVRGWNTADEEDVWDIRLDFGAAADEDDPPLDDDLTVSELIEWRYYRAEKQKELGNAAFKSEKYEVAIRHYTRAREIEPELPHYSLNLAAAHLKLSQWVQAEHACTVALDQHRSSKGFWRRARARRMQRKHDDAIRDLHAVLELSPGNSDAILELALLASETRASDEPSCSTSSIFNHDPGPCALSVPWDIAPEDARQLRVVALPLTADPAGRPSQTLACPSWERYSVRRVD